jgi:predicted dehydrogenase
MLGEQPQSPSLEGNRVTELVRIGLMGYGRGGRYFHAPLIAQAPECVLAAVVTRSPQRRAELVDDHPGTPAVDDIDGLIAAGIDAVVISTPLPSHVPLVYEMIGRRVPVVCDKPFASDAATARAAVKAAEDAATPLTVYQNRRWDADFLTVRTLLDSGRLGEPLAFESRMEQYPPAGGFSTTGGGVLLDFGAHIVDQAQQLFGRVESVYAEKHDVPGLGGFDDRFFAALHHRNGVTSHLWATWALQGAPGPRFRVVGTAATYAAESDDGQADRLLAGHSPVVDADAFGTVPPQRWGRLYRGEGDSGEPVPAERGTWSSFYSRLAGALRDKADLPVDPWDSVAALAVLDAARISATRRQVVTVETG